MARDGETLAAGARRLLEHLAGGAPSGPGEPGVDGQLEQFHLTAEGMDVIAARPD